jgi:hypothetical protein
VAATKPPAPERSEDHTEPEQKVNLQVLKSTTQSVDTLIASHNGSQRQPLDAAGLKRVQRNEELIGTSLTVESSQYSEPCIRDPKPIGLQSNNPYESAVTNTRTVIMKKLRKAK